MVHQSIQILKHFGFYSILIVYIQFINDKMWGILLRKFIFVNSFCLWLMCLIFHSYNHSRYITFVLKLYSMFVNVRCWSSAISLINDAMCTIQNLIVHNTWKNCVILYNWLVWYGSILLWQVEQYSRWLTVAFHNDLARPGLEVMQSRYDIGVPTSLATYWNFLLCNVFLLKSASSFHSKYSNLA